MNVDPALIVKYDEQADRDQDRRQLALVEEEPQDTTPDRHGLTLLPRRLGRRGSSRRWSARLHARRRLVRDRGRRLQGLLRRGRPSNLFFARYGSTVDLTTMPRPVSVFVGFISPPETLYR